MYHRSVRVSVRVCARVWVCACDCVLVFAFMCVIAIVRLCIRKQQAHTAMNIALFRYLFGSFPMKKYIFPPQITYVFRRFPLLCLSWRICLRQTHAKDTKISRSVLPWIKTTLDPKSKKDPTRKDKTNDQFIPSDSFKIAEWNNFYHWVKYQQSP